MARDLRHILKTELEAFKALSFYDFRDDYDSHKNWRNVVFTGVVRVTQQNDDKLVSDDHKTGISFANSAKALREYSYIKAAKAMVIIDKVIISGSIAMSPDTHLKDGEKGSIYDKDGKLNLPVYDTNIADKIMAMSADDCFKILLSQGTKFTEDQKKEFTLRYTVLGYENIGGEDMVILRNPWGIGTVQAELNKVTGAISIKRANKNIKGAFLVPRDTFLFMFSRFYTINVTKLVNENKKIENNLGKAS